MNSTTLSRQFNHEHPQYLFDLKAPTAEQRVAVVIMEEELKNAECFRTDIQPLLSIFRGSLSKLMILNINPNYTEHLTILLTYIFHHEIMSSLQFRQCMEKIMTSKNYHDILQTRLQLEQSAITHLRLR